MDSSNRQRLKELFHGAVELAPRERQAFLDAHCAGDVGLHGEVAALLTAHEAASGFIERSALVDAGLIEADEAKRDAAVTGQQIGGYEIIRELGRGGMGTVFLAGRPDDPYLKQVAIKLINRGMDSDAIVKRFVMERQILANLDHPNIARLIDGGTTEDGRPFLVMEYIEGVSITRYCDEHRPNTTRRLQLFRQVCAAVQFAHQNLIVHRDLKPSNILVTGDGMPKLLDFGVAKLLSSAPSLDDTATIARVLTPEYASPEQLEGLPVTTASDVYSLGVILYELLSGHRPFHFAGHQPQEMVRLIRSSEPVRPSIVFTSVEAARPTGGNERPKLTPEAISRTRDGSVDKLRRRLSGDLDNILLKALRNEPARRYASVLEFSEDIRRHLDGLPVGARPDTFAYRLNKFVTRHKLGVAAAVMIVLTLATATAVTSWQARVARRERARAEQRYGEIRKLSNSLITEIQSSLTTIPGTAPTQRLLAQKSLDYLDALARDDDRDIGILGELSAAYLNVGELQSWTLQDNAGALQSYQKAVALQRKRVLLAPQDVAVKKDLAFALFKLSEALEGLSREGEIIHTWDEIIALYNALLASDPANQDLLSSVAGSYQQRGDLQRIFNRPQAADTDFRLALAAINQHLTLAQATARDPQARANLSFAYIQQGSTYGDLAEWHNAAESFRLAGEIAEPIYRADPGMIEALRQVASSHNQRGDALDKLGDHQGALDNYRYALAVVTDARTRDPNSNDLRYAEAKDTFRVGIGLAKLNDLPTSFTQMEKGLELVRKYIDEDRSRSATVTYGTELFQQAADFLAAHGRRPQAIAVYREALAILGQTADGAGADSRFRYLIAGYEAAVGDLYAGLDPETKAIGTPGRAALISARSQYQQSLQHLRELQARGVFYSDFASRVADITLRLSVCETALANLKS
jgi:serine/threonine protein kinase